MILHPKDNVEVFSDGQKYAVRYIKKGEDIVKYGFPIGHAECDIRRGEKVGPHNLKTDLSGLGKWEYAPYFFPKQKSKQGTFKGYLRSNGEVGIRNELYIIPTVGCINNIVRNLADEYRDQNVKALCHPYGCSQLGGDLLTTQKTLAGLIRHPNAGGVLVLGLGCENNGIGEMKKVLGEYDTERIRFLNVQDCEDEMEEGRKIIDELLLIMRDDIRTDVPLSKLRIGVKCGGSDGYSGITANPTVGRVSDKFYEYGAAVLMTEVPEVFGAEKVLLSKCANREVFDSASEMIRDFRKYFISHGESIAENPSPGNIAGGITTLEEKSLGCVTKTGDVPLCGTLDIGNVPCTGGLYLVFGPGNDMVAITNLSASGAHLILFTTGRGTPLSSVVPTLKISTNTKLYEKKPHWIDFDSGRLLIGIDMETLSEELFSLVLRVAEGEMTQAEKTGSYDIAIFKNGVTL